MQSVLQELQLKHQALEAFKETIALFEEQMKLLETFKNKAAPQELPKLVPIFLFLRLLRTQFAFFFHFVFAVTNFY